MSYSYHLRRLTVLSLKQDSVQVVVDSQSVFKLKDEDGHQGFVETNYSTAKHYKEQAEGGHQILYKVLQNQKHFDQLNKISPSKEELTYARKTKKP